MSAKAVLGLLLGLLVGLLAVLGTIGLAVASLRHDPVIQLLWVWAGRLWTSLCGALPAALALLVLGGTLLALRHALKWSAAHAELAYPRYGLQPSIVIDAQDNRPAWLRRLAPRSHKTLLLPGRNERAEIARAVFAGAEGDGAASRITSSVARQVLNPRPDEALLPAPLPELPERIDIFSAPLPPRGAPALLLGVSQEGAVTLPLDEGGHIVIGGSPRSGKSNLLAAFIAQVARGDPRGELVQIALTDLKEVDFKLLPDDLACLHRPVARDVGAALALVQALERELLDRQQLFAATRCRTLTDYNHQQGTRLPYILIIIDEIAQISDHPDKDTRDEFRRSVTRIGQLGAAFGFMLIMATQRLAARSLSKDITGLCDTRIALHTATQAESELILDVGGAESLPLVKGRALVKNGQLLEIQTFYAGLRDGRFDDLMARLPRQIALAPGVTLELPADAGPSEAWHVDGVGAADQPDGVTAGSTGSSTVMLPAPSGPAGALRTYAEPGTATVPLPVTIDLEQVKSAADLDARQRAHIIAVWSACVRDGKPHLNEAQRRLFPHYTTTGGRAYQVLEPVIRAYYTGRGLRPPWQKRGGNLAEVVDPEVEDVA